MFGRSSNVAACVVAAPLAQTHRSRALKLYKNREFAAAAAKGYSPSRTAVLSGLTHLEQLRSDAALAEFKQAQPSMAPKASHQRCERARVLTGGGIRIP